MKKTKIKSFSWFWDRVLFPAYAGFVCVYLYDFILEASKLGFVSPFLLSLVFSGTIGVWIGRLVQMSREIKKQRLLQNLYFDSQQK